MKQGQAVVIPRVILYMYSPEKAVLENDVHSLHCMEVSLGHLFGWHPKKKKTKKLFFKFTCTSWRGGPV